MTATVLTCIPQHVASENNMSESKQNFTNKYSDLLTILKFTYSSGTDQLSSLCPELLSATVSSIRETAK